MDPDADARAYDALTLHPRRADLATIARAAMTGAAESRRAERRPDRVAEAAKERGLTREDAMTSFGNALDVLERGPEDDAERALACALAAHALALEPPRDREAEDRAAADLLWLATHTPFDATGLVDKALGDSAGSLWGAIADRIRRFDEGKLAALGRGEAIVGAVALGASRAPGAVEKAAALAAEAHDRKIARVLAARPAGAGAERDAIAGEMAPPPRGPVATALLACTGLLLVVQGVRLLGRVAFAYRRPAELALGDDGGVRVKWRTELLGRTLRDREAVVPRTALATATRDVRYPGLAMYAGLLALAAGSWVGVATFVDGVRAASPSLLASGLAIVALGLALDFALSSVAAGARGRCRVLVAARDGSRLCVGGVDVKRADALLARLAKPQ